ncbi:MAG: mismatch repair protein MutS [Crocinitomicaceae bacterium]|nr:mismatch repair protein MutS [Crocinitomicaceae bacterium]
MTALTFYEKQLPELEILVKQARKKVQSLSLLRLLVFLLLASSLVFFWGNSLLIGVSMLLGIPAFLAAVAFSVDAKTDLEKKESKIRLILAEIRQISTNKGQFDPGSDFTDSKHAFAYDLDLFTPNGFFAFVNRTTSSLGKKRLAEHILFPQKAPDLDFEQKVETLSAQVNWMLEFRAAADITSRESAYHKSLSDFARLEFKNPSWVKFAAWLIPAASIAALALNYTGYISNSIFGLVLVFTLLPISALLKETNRWASQVGQYEARIRVLLDQLILLRQLPLDLVPKTELEQLEKELKSWVGISRRFDIRLNIVVSIPLNMFAAWDLRQRLALSAWSEKNKRQLENWENELADIEVLISAAVLRFNNREHTIFAARQQHSAAYSCKGIVHPMISPEKRVKNDFELRETESFVILTGPNMAGKSTYLRAVGINLVLAGAGFPVFAATFEIPETRLFSSMRTSDDLAQESSYFHAELTRLKYIQQQLDPGYQTFVLLDEILKGTNSKDKEEGSKKFLRKMKLQGAKGIIATHDLSLCDLEKEDPAFVTNYFDSTIQGNELYFDYSLKKGVCQNMNASFLLKKMDLID